MYPNLKLEILKRGLLKVRAFDDSIAAQWDRFVLSQPKGSMFQLTSWKRVIEKTFGHQACYFYAERDGKITAVAPLFSISNWLVGRCLLSVPLGVYGGICAEDAEGEQVLIDHLKQFAESQRVDYLELRNRNGGLRAGFHANTLYVTFTTPLSADPEANLKCLPKDTRYEIRKAEKAGLRAERGVERLNDFYGVFADTMRRHGTPVFPRSLFENLAQEFGEQVDLSVVYEGSRPVAGAVSFLFRDTIQPYYVGGNLAGRRVAAGSFLYWELMKRAAQAGIRRFDFGRSKRGTGPYAFKTKWNTTLEALDYQVYLVQRKTIPNFSPVNPKFQLATRVWRQLPLWLTMQVGPRVVRWFP